MDEDEIEKLFRLAEFSEPLDEGQLASLARQDLALSLKSLAQLADGARDAKVATDAQRALEASLKRIRTLIENPETPSDVRSELQRELRKFLDA